MNNFQIKHFNKQSKINIVRFFAIILIMSSLFIFSFGVKDKLVTIKANDNIYGITQYQLEHVSIDENNNCNMIDLYTINNSIVTAKPNYRSLVNQNGYILISSALDLYAFSYLANTNSDFLTYRYQLESNIYYNEVDHAFIPIAFDSLADKSFSGVFDGNGFEIYNLNIVELNDNADIFNKYRNIEYYAMFSSNKGTIKNLGLVDSFFKINSSSYPILHNIGTLVGLNDTFGIIDSCYVKDLRDPQNDDDSGILTLGGFQISGFVSENKGLMKDCYVAYSIVCNYAVTDYVDFSEMLSHNENGTITNCYFYNSTIKEYTLTDNNTKENIVYDPNLVGRTFTKMYYGCVRVEEIDDINDLFTNKTGWYTKATYDTKVSNRLKDYFNIETPILRGINTRVNQDVTEFDITNLKEFLYAFELMNSNPIFSSSICCYILKTDLDLSLISQHLYKVDSEFGASFIGGTVENHTIEAYDVLGNISSYPTIYNPRIDNTILVDGIECYGFIPWLTGEIKNINFYSDPIQYIEPKSGVEKKAIGVVSGLVEAGKIENVNVLTNILITKNIGRYCMGGISGIVADMGSVVNVTMAGTINAQNNVYTDYDDTNDPNFLNGNCFGGVIGYTKDTVGKIVKAFNASTLYASIFTTDTSKQQHVGGVIGGGYTYICEELGNIGNIYVGTNGNSNIGVVYVAGVIGHHLGLSFQVDLFYNQGDITIYNNNKNSFVSGVTNVEIQTVTQKLSASNLKDNKARIAYFASSFTNASNIIINNQSQNTTLSGVCNIITNNDNKFLSNIYGLYNLGYRYVMGQNGDLKAYQKVKINSQQVRMNLVPKYSGLLTTTGTTSDQLIELKKAYNLKNIDFSTNADSTTNYLYSGGVLGKFINFEDVRNEGSLTFNVTNSLGYDNKTIRISGVFEEVSSGCFANKIYNGGHISFNSSNSVTGDVIINGICNYNRNGFTLDELKAFNPTSPKENNKEVFDDSKTGSLNDVINNGDITCTNSTFNNLQKQEGQKLSSNEDIVLATTYTITEDTNGSHFTGNIHVAGITYINESVITNTFNLGDIYAANFIPNQSQELKINASGISTLNTTKSSYIINSANNGIIKAINLSSFENSNVNASGISVQNDILESGNYTNNSNHSKQLIAFTINYGSVYAFNQCDNILSSAFVPRSKASGILAMGLCNIINTVNYGNIYGNETASGLFGVVYFQKFSSEVDSNNLIYIANSINYGNVRVIDKGTNKYKDNTSEYISYSYFNSFSETNSNIGRYARINIDLEEGINYFIGSIFAIVNFNGDDKANYVTIRYLISFLDKIKITGAEASTPSTVTTDVSTIYSAFYKLESTHVIDKYMNQNVVYSPLSTTSKVLRINGVDIEYMGIFNEEFPFRQAIESRGNRLSEEHITDKFVPNYFQYVNYKKINDRLLDKIGWRDIAYFTAANDFAQNLDYMIIFLNKYKTLTSNDYNELVTDSLNTPMWSLHSSSNVLAKATESILEINDQEYIENLLVYLFSDECETSKLITSSLRKEIINMIVDKMGVEIFTIINFINYNSKGYSELLGEVLSTSKSNEVKDFIVLYLDNHNVSSNDKKQFITNYFNYLTSNPSYFNDMSQSDRLSVLKSIIDQIDDDTLLEVYNNLNSSNKTLISNLNKSSIDEKVAMYSEYEKLTETEKMQLFESIINNNSNDNIVTYLNSMVEDVRLFQVLNSRGYDYTSFEEIKSAININGTSTSETVIDKRLELYNQIRNTDTFRTYLTGKNPVTSGSEYYAEATEFRNTYQTLGAHIPNGYRYGDLAYVYETTITPSTNFFGPYTNNSGAKLIESNPNVELSAYPRTDSGTSRSVFISKDKSFMDDLKSRGLINDYYVFLYEFASDKSNNQLCNIEQFTGEDFNNGNNGIIMFNGKETDFTGCELRDDVDIWLTDNNGITFNARGGVISLFTANISKGREERSNSISGTYYIRDKDKNKHDFIAVENDRTGNHFYTWVDLIINYGLRYYIAIPTTSYHSTASTGYRAFYQVWRDGDSYPVASYFIWKNNNQLVKTSKYIDYSVDDLLKLDGILTSYQEVVTPSQDERSIINDLFNRYFCNSDSNRIEFEKIIKKSLLESLKGEEGYVDEFFNTNINSSKKINNVTPFNYLKTTNNETVRNYLVDRISLTNNDIRNKLLFASTANLEVYKDVINNIMDYTQNVYVISGNQTFNNKTYTQGVNGNIEINGVVANSNIRIVARTTDGVPTDVVLRNGNSTRNITINSNNINQYEFTGLNQTSYVLEVPRNVVLYDVTGMVSQDGTWTPTINDNQYSFVYNQPSSLDGNQIEEITRIDYNYSIYNNSNSNGDLYIYVDNTTNTILPSTTVSRHTTKTGTINLNISNGSTVYVRKNRSNLNGQYIFNTSGNSFKITYIYYKSLVDISNYVEKSISNTIKEDTINSTLLYNMPLNTQNSENTVIGDMLNSNDFLNLLASYSNENTLSVIQSLDDKELLVEVLKIMLNNNYRYFNSIISYMNSGGRFLDDTQKNILASAYLVSDYQYIYEQSLTNPLVNISSTELKTKLNYFNSNCRYINNNGTLNNEYFDNLLEEIGLSITASGYGIYALSSNKGILNGLFIPDNISLDSMDVNYQIGNDYIDMLENTDSNISSSWRKGDSTENCLEGGVSWGFFKDMKQLKLSISTTVFELDLKYGNNVIKSSPDLIDLDNHKIVYYVTTALNGTTFSLNKDENMYYSIANQAKILNNISITADSSKGETGTSAKLTVQAEDPTIETEYDVIIYCIDMDYNATIPHIDDGLPTVAYNGGSLTVAITKTNDNRRLPEGFDLTPYVSIVKIDSNDVIIPQDNSVFTLGGDPIIDKYGNATLELYINSKLAFGDDCYVRISLFDNDLLTKNCQFEKIASTECDITGFEFEGNYLTNSWVLNNGIYYTTSPIKYGRTFTKSQLEDLENSYLSYLSYSDCATISVSAICTSVNNNTNNSLTEYHVTYVVTAESLDTKTYVHRLIEIEPNTTPSVYQNGEHINASGTISSNNEVNVSFNRGEEPTNRIKYNLNNVDVTDGIFYSTVNGEGSMSGVVMSASFTGLSIDIDEVTSPGVYQFNYIFEYPIYWTENTMITKVYVYPTINIEKKYSQDAMLNRLAFLENAVAIGTFNTAMNADYAIVNKQSTEPREVIYTSLVGSDDPNRIVVSTKNIDYKAKTDNLNYYAVGSISNAHLSDYAPTLGINKYAEVYQYFTLNKINNYGFGKQGNTLDTTCTTTTKEQDLYLYVPFTNSNGVDEIFVVKVVNGRWTSIYDDGYLGENGVGQLATYNYNTQGFIYNSETYVKSQYAGSTDLYNNKSLYMDYIGTPLDDHFWYVSYAVFSESYLNIDNNDPKAPKVSDSDVRFYHISTIDASNTVYFEITIKVANGVSIDINDVYLSITDNVYKKKENSTDEEFNNVCYISAFAHRNDSSEQYFVVTNNLQTVPRGYFYFFLDLPASYSCTYTITNGRTNRNQNDDEIGAYLPPASLVTQRVKIEFTITNENTSVIWGESTATVFGVQAIEVVDNQN